jgi:hypothetical protein
MKLLEEMYGGVGGLDNFDRAVEMINAAVEHHDRNDNFDAIADIDGLIQFLKGQYHDFTPELENSVREIIADEMSGNPSEEQEERTWKTHMRKVSKKPVAAPTKKQTRDDVFRPRGRRHHDALVKAAKHEEEESISDRIARMRRETKDTLADIDKRRQARKYGISGPSSRRRRLGSRARGRITSTEQEEITSLSDRRTRRDRFRPDVRKNRRGHRHSDPMRRRAQLMARKARPHVGLEQEEVNDEWRDAQERSLARLPDCKKCGGSGYEQKGMKRTGRWNCTACKGTGKQLHAEQEERKTNYDMQTTDWNKEVDKFRERRKKYEPSAARSQRRSRRRMSGPSGNAFSLRFESFKGFLEKNETSNDS